MARRSAAEVYTTAEMGYCSGRVCTAVLGWIAWLMLVVVGGPLVVLDWVVACGLGAKREMEEMGWISWHWGQKQTIGVNMAEKGGRRPEGEERGKREKERGWIGGCYIEQPPVTKLRPFEGNRGGLVTAPKPRVSSATERLTAVS